MNWKDIGAAIGNAAPMVGGLLAGPAGAAIGSVVAATLGVDNTPDSVNNALKNNPDALVRLQELQVNSKVELQKLAVTAQQHQLEAELLQYKAEVDDRNSARELAAKQPNDLIRPTITILMVLGAIAIVFLVFSGYSKDLLTDATASLTIGTVMGYWFSEVKQVMAFWFGTTKDTGTQSSIITRFAVSPDTVVDKSKEGSKNA